MPTAAAAAARCCAAGLEREQGEVAGLQAELAKVQAEQGALPALVKELAEALEAEAAAFQRQEAGTHAPGGPGGGLPVLGPSRRCGGAV